MKSKFLDYWVDIPMLYAFAFILDPRAKIIGFSNVLQLMSQLTGKDYSSYLTDVRAELSTIFGKYEAKYGSVRMQRATQPGPAGKKKTAWGKIFGSQAASSTYSAASLGAGLGSTSVSSSLSRRQSASALLQAAQTGASLAAASELSAYLDSDTINQYDDDFNILTWWHEHKLSYPVLSILARDVMTVPVSTISSESAFSTTGRIIEERRRRLTPEMVEILALIKDWEQGDARLQHTVDDTELEESFEDLYLDES
nr:zinc finger BED domain-containing protein RICESLEEPER 1-like [Setaria viridis]